MYKRHKSRKLCRLDKKDFRWFRTIAARKSWATKTRNVVSKPNWEPKVNSSCKWNAIAKLRTARETKLRLVDVKSAPVRKPPCLTRNKPPSANKRCKLPRKTSGWPRTRGETRWLPGSERTWGKNLMWHGPSTRFNQASFVEDHVVSYSNRLADRP